MKSQTDRNKKLTLVIRRLELIPSCTGQEAGHRTTIHSFIINEAWRQQEQCFNSFRFFIRKGTNVKYPVISYYSMLLTTFNKSYSNPSTWYDPHWVFLLCVDLYSELDVWLCSILCAAHNITFCCHNNLISPRSQQLILLHITFSPLDLVVFWCFYCITP